MRGRHAIAKAMLRSIPKELRGWRILTLVVMDETDVDEMRPFLRDLHIEGRLVTYSVEENSPLTRKWQKGLDYMKDLKVDALCIQGSDDFASLEYWQNGADLLATAVAPFGVRSCWMLDTATGRMGLFSMGSPDRPIGCGRFFPRAILDAAEWKLWDIDLDRGLDGAAEDRLAKLGIKFSVLDIPGVMVDVKNNENINRFDKFMNFMGAGMSRFDKVVEREEAQQILRDAGLDWSAAMIGAA
jgi:hypothetical protein